MPDQHGNPGDGGSQGIDLARTGGVKISTQQQILGRIAAQGKFGGQHQVGAEHLGATGKIEDAGGIAGEVADRGIDLGNGDFQGHDLLAGSEERLYPPLERPGGQKFVPVWLVQAGQFTAHKFDFLGVIGARKLAAHETETQ